MISSSNGDRFSLETTLIFINNSKSLNEPFDRKDVLARRFIATISRNNDCAQVPSAHLHDELFHYCQRLASHDSTHSSPSKTSDVIGAKFPGEGGLVWMGMFHGCGRTETEIADRSTVAGFQALGEIPSRAKALMTHPNDTLILIMEHPSHLTANGVVLTRFLGQIEAAISPHHFFLICHN